LGTMLDGLLRVDPDRAVQIILPVLQKGPRAAVALLVLRIIEQQVVVPAASLSMHKLGEVFSQGSEAEAAAVVDLLVRTADPAAVNALGEFLAKASWEKRELAIRGLGALKRIEGAKYLEGQLTGTSAGTAALALADLGASSASEALLKALESAAPAQELEILLALARLGSDQAMSRALEKIHEPAPDVRLVVARVFGVLGTSEAKAALGSMRYDLDRLVRAEVEKHLAENGGASR